MSTVELKDELKKKIDEIEDNLLLEEMLELLNLDDSENTEFEIPAVHKKSLEIGLQQAENSETKTNKEVQSNLKNGLANNLDTHLTS